MNYNIKINLSHLKGATILKNKETKKRAIVIPLGEGSHLFEGKTGIFLNATAWTVQHENGYNESHYIKQTIAKDVYEKLSMEEKRSLPIIGSLSEFVGAWEQQNTQVVSQGTWESQDGDDLPF